jgi:hypothetical protein
MADKRNACVVVGQAPAGCEGETPLASACVGAGQAFRRPSRLNARPVTPARASARRASMGPRGPIDCHAHAGARRFNWCRSVRPCLGQ